MYETRFSYITLQKVVESCNVKDILERVGIRNNINTFVLDDTITIYAGIIFKLRTWRKVHNYSLSEG